MRQQRWVIGVALITALGLLCESRWRLDAAPAGTIHYPDLQVVIPLDSFSITVNSPTAREFRYTHDQANLGDGPFELRLDYDPTTDTAKAFERIYTHDASINWSIAGEVPVVGRFLYHPAHGHYHVPFASFGLFRVAADGSVGAQIAVSPKVGFCIADSVLIASIPHEGVFGYTGDHCADPRSILGISVGWGDLYDFHDDGQAIVYDPAAIPDGEYWFRAIADPFNYFVEKNETNNITDIRVRITGTAVTVVAGPFHPDSTPAAVSLTAPPAGAVSGTVTLSANASHASGISSVQFLLDGNPLGSPDTTSPYTLLWNTTTVPDGSHDLSAQALTPTGLYGTSPPVFVTVANNGPPPPPPPSQVTISDVLVTKRTTSSATVTWTTNLLATSEVAYGPTSTYGLFASDGSFVTTHSVLLTGLTPTTTYHYQVTSRDAVGNSATAGDFIFTTPAVSDLECNLTAPVGGSILSGIINVQAEAFGTASVRGLQFLLDGAPLGAEFTLEPYILPWDTRSVLNGSHVLSAVVRDPTNNQATCAPVPVTVSNSGPSTVGLVAALGFDENQGTVANDRTANANNGFISGATWTSSGRFGSALVFDGSNDIVTVNDANSLDLTNALTLEAWVFPTTLSGWRTALMKERPGGLAYALYAHDNVPRPASYVNVGGLDRSAAGTTSLPLNTWSHLATTYDGVTLRLFVNAVQVGATAITGSAAVSGNQLSIGGNTVWGEFFAGRLDEIRIYNRTLTQAEIQIDMNAPVTPVSIQVPSVIGLTQAAATTQITGAGLSVGTVTSANSTTVPAGSVISQNPTGGTMVAAGSAVNLVISLGPTQANVPNVVGLLQAAAQTAIVNAGLVVGSISSQNNTAPAGTVIAQSPTAGTLVNAGTPVALTVSLGPATTCPCTIWPSSTVPTNSSVNDFNAVEVGVKFRTSVPGSISGIRFYKGPQNSGVHVGNLWSATGTLLATATFSAESAQGWQGVTFGTPVPVTANTTYVASYQAPNGGYAGDNRFFSGAGVTNGPLQALADGVDGGNGVYRYGPSGFPTQTFMATNYWVDVVFVTSGGIQVPSVVGLTQAAATTQITGAGLSVGTVTSSNSATVPVGSVISQNPTGGTMVAAGSAVNLVISLGPTQASVPNVVGLLQAAAQTAIVNAGLVVGSISSQNSNTVPAGNVIAQSPNAGTLVNPGTPVTLTVSLGPPPPPGQCNPATSNAIVCENTQPGAPASVWDITGAGDDTIQGFATDISVDQGQTVFFKINTPSTQYRLDIFRMGYYGGMGARQVATVAPSVSLPQSQPNCLTDIPTGLVDCGNWAVSASWTVPTTAVSGIYFAKVQRLDAAGASHIVFIVRDDDGHSDLLFQTSDTTWQAYNRYGGNSLYVGDPAGRAYKVSYNRPFSTRTYAPEDWVFNSEYPMVRWLEANGYSVSYSTGVDTDRRGSELLEHKIFLSVGHDEYWSGAQRTNVEAARAAGIHLAFFSGNEIFWKTRWENSISTGATPYRTLVSYKETHANAKIDPLPNTWTGTWRDPRFSPPADGGRPENALSGNISMVNDPSTTSIQVPSSKSPLRFWRNTSIASLAPGAVATLPFGTLGYEWDEELDNGFRPPGLIRLSDTVVNGVPILQDYGSTYGSGTANHALTLYRHTSGALVFGAGTIQWSWGLDSQHDRGNDPPSLAMQQATVNLLADMSVQPLTLQAGLFTAVGSTDTVGPTSAITSPTNNSAVPANATITITGTATDSGGGVVGGVEVSVNGGATWQRATGREAWTFAWQTGGSPGTATLVSRATDDSGNVGVSSQAVAVTVGTPDTSAPILVITSAANPFTTYYAEILQAEGLNAFTAVDITQVTATLLAAHDVVILGEVGLAPTQVTMFTNWVNNGGNLIAMRPDKKLAPLLGLADAGTTLSEGYLLVNTATSPGAGIATDYTWTFTTGSSGTPTDWTLCASEGGVCAFTGTMDVRYGANGSYFFKTLSNGTPCTNAVFGDPIFGTAKACAIRSGAPQPTDWTFCAAEGGNCAFTGTMQVRYGANGSYFYQTLSNGTPCTNAVFGDPISGAAKRCAITSPPPTDWTSCASEGGVCAFTGTMEVRYGANGSYAYKTLSNGTPCTNGVFGDPVFGVAKSCSIRTVSVSPPTVRALRPASGAPGAAVDDSIAVTFNGTVNPATVTSATFELRDASNALVPATVTYSAETRTATLTPSTALAASTQYTAHLRGGTGGIADPAGNTLSVGTMQFHGAADRYTLAGASTVATLYADATVATASPAVTLRSVGSSGGQAAAFTYDLARSVVYTRQGNPAWAGQERDGNLPIRSDDLFFGGGQADWVDLAKVAIPQADEQQRLFANLIQFVNADRKPIPRFWYLPRGLKAVVVMTGDDHANNGTQGRFDIYQANSPAGCSVVDWQCVRATSYIDPSTPIAPSQAAAYVANGFEIAAHITTGCADYTPSSLAATYSVRLGQFAGGFPGLPAPKTNRTHCVVWSDYSTQPTVELANGIRFDTNYYYFPGNWVNNTPGLFTGSGMPMRFARFDGTLVDVYQATTQLTDESQQTYPFTIDTLLNRALGPEGYYGVFTANMHTDTAVHAGSVAIVASAQARGVPIVSSLQMLQWLDGRNASSFQNLTWSGTTLTFAINVGAGANGLQALLPVSSGAGTLTTISRGGVPISYTLQTLKGIQYAVFTATAGAYQATYGS